MRFFKVTKEAAVMAPEQLTDRELRRLADEAERLDAAKAERARRDERAQAADRRRAAKAAEESRVRHVHNIAELTKRTAAEAASAHDALVRAVIETGRLLAVRDGVIGRWTGLRDELVAHGSSAAAPVLTNTPEVVGAALRLGGALAEIVVSGDAAFSGPTGDTLAKIHAAAHR